MSGSLNPLPRFENIRFLPILHYHLEFADSVRQAVERWQVEAIAVELPSTLEERVLRAVQRLPELSVLFYEDSRGEPVYLSVEPADGLIEAVRSGLERQLPVYFVDLDVDEYPLYHEAMPDPYAVYRLGLSTYWRAYHLVVPEPRRSEEDLLRERNMAWHLQQIAPRHRSVLFVCGMAHVAGVLEQLGIPQARPLGRVRRPRVQIFNVHPESAREVMGEMPFLSAVYERRRRGFPTLETSLRQVLTEVERDGLRLISSGLATEGQQRAERWQIYDALAIECSQDPTDAFSPLDRQRVQLGLVQAAREAYERHTGEELKPFALRTWLKFCRNYALVEGHLLPDLYQLVIGARGVADDNLAYEVWDLGSFWPWQQERASFPTARIRADEMWVGTRKFRLRRKFPRRRVRLQRVPVKRRRSEGQAGEWIREFEGGWGICSYPPEDLVIEGFGNFLKQKAKRMLSEENTRVEKFTTSLLDGIDLRETIRHWYEKELYVQEMRRIAGQVGSVVVIFDEDLGHEKYPWRMTWLGEHDQESDMAFYATPMERQIIGPGIARCEYGGFLLSYPPLRMQDIWQDPFFDVAETKPERLLLAGLDYSEEKHVVYVGPWPPRSWFQSVAARMGRQIVYVPLGSLSPVTLKKIRVFHVLSGHDKRAIAKEYIW